LSTPPESYLGRKLNRPTTGPLGALSDHQLELGAVVAFALAMIVIYAWTGPGQHDTDGFFLLAQSFLHGHLSIDGSRPWIEVVPAGGGRWYLPFPPVPAVVLTPIVALFGTEWIDTSGVCAFVGGLNILLIWALLRRLGLKIPQAIWLTAAFALGSEATYVMATGGVHHWVQTLGLMFALAALVLAVRQQAPYLAGVCLLLAAGCRPPFLLATPAYLWLYMGEDSWRDWRARGRAWFDRAFFFAGGAVPIGLFLLAYNIARFGTPWEFGYDRIVGMTNGASVLSESWYAKGIESITYIPRGLFTMFLRTFNYTDAFPWLQPSWAGASILLTMPVLFYLGRALFRDRLVFIGWLGMTLPLILDLMHGNPGYAQFGYRFFLDGLPFAWLLLAVVARRQGVTRGMKLAIEAGIFVYAYGLWCVAANFMTS